MFNIINNTPFQAATTVLMDQRGDNLAVVAVKATFTIPFGKNAMELADNQLPPLFMEEYYDSPEKSGIKYPADLVPGKPNTDVGLSGTVYSQYGKPVEKTDASVQVDSLYKKIQVYGDRRWTKSLFSPGYKKTRPEPFDRMPLSCDRIFGGTDTDEKDHLIEYAPNPHGTGYIINKHHVGTAKLPNFEDPKQRITSWKTKPCPAHFGFSNPASAPRAAFAGTYDDAWRKNQFPLYPVDMDMRFFNCAQPELIADGYLQGGETVVLKHLSPDGLIRFTLPATRIRLEFCIGKESLYKKADLYTLMIEPDLKRFFMAWGTSISCGDNFANLKYVAVEMLNNEETHHVKTH